MLVNYACHATTLGFGNRLISPDYLGTLRQTIEKATEDSVAMFLQGASGELAPRNAYGSDPAAADHNGRQLAYAVLSALNGMMPPRRAVQFDGAMPSGAVLALWREVDYPPPTKLAAKQRHVELTVRSARSGEKNGGHQNGNNDPVLAERMERRRLLLRTLGDSTSAQMPMRQRFPHLAIVVMNIVNGYLSYLPPARLYAADAYPVEVSLFEAGCLERTIEACVQAINQLSSPVEEGDIHEAE